MERDKWLATDVVELSKRINDSFSLMGFLGKAEKEAMVAQTIKAATVNLIKYGEPFSFHSEKLNYSSRLFQNRECYKQLLKEGLLVEEQRNIDGVDRTVIFPTRLLLDKLGWYFAKEKK